MSRSLPPDHINKQRLHTAYVGRYTSRYNVCNRFKSIRISRAYVSAWPEWSAQNGDWKSGGEAFMGLAIPEYPNMFLIAGSNSANPAGSNPEMKEAQTSYIMRCLQWKEDSSSQVTEVSRKATLI